MIFGDHSRIGKSMKNLFQPEAVDEVMARIGTLQPATPRVWGKMDVAQMMAVVWTTRLASPC